MVFLTKEILDIIKNIMQHCFIQLLIAHFEKYTIIIVKVI